MLTRTFSGDYTMRLAGEVLENVWTPVHVWRHLMSQRRDSELAHEWSSAIIRLMICTCAFSWWRYKLQLCDRTAVGEDTTIMMIHKCLKSQFTAHYRVNCMSVVWAAGNEWTREGILEKGKNYYLLWEFRKCAKWQACVTREKMDTVATVFVVCNTL